MSALIHEVEKLYQPTTFSGKGRGAPALIPSTLTIASLMKIIFKLHQSHMPSLWITWMEVKDFKTFATQTILFTLWKILRQSCINDIFHCRAASQTKASAEMCQWQIPPQIHLEFQEQEEHDKAIDLSLKRYWVLTQSRRHHTCNPSKVFNFKPLIACTEDTQHPAFEASHQSHASLFVLLS